MDRGYRRWHRYGYDNANKIVADTIYAEGYEVDGRPSGTTLTVTNFTYDAEDRIIPPASYILNMNPAAHYDSSGNYLFLGANASPSYYPYNYQTNFLRTNKIWMFLGMNYSVNEFSFIDPVDRSYPGFNNWNDCKLATYFNNNQMSAYPNFFTNSFFTKFFDISWKEMHIVYECSCNCDSSMSKR